MRNYLDTVLGSLVKMKKETFCVLMLFYKSKDEATNCFVGIDFNTFVV